MNIQGQIGNKVYTLLTPQQQIKKGLIEFQNKIYNF